MEEIVSNREIEWAKISKCMPFCFALLTEEGRILALNYQAQEFLQEVQEVHGGDTPDQFIGKHVSVFYKSELAEYVTQKLASKDLPFTLDINAGDDERIAKYYFYLRDRAGKKLGPALMWRSVTEEYRKATEKELKRSENLHITVKRIEASILDITEKFDGSLSGALQMVQMLRKISSASKTLAINATIEAARSTDMNSAFNATALEFRELSRSSAQISKEVAEKIEEILALNNDIKVISKSISVDISAEKK